MSTFIPAIPLLTADESTTKLAKTVVETSPGVFALNTVGGGGGSQIPIIKFNKFNGVPLSLFQRVGRHYYYPNYDDNRLSITFQNKELNIFILYNKNVVNAFKIELKNNDDIVYISGYDSSKSYFTIRSLPFNYQPVGLPE